MQSEQRKDGFFYGLFMNSEVLEASGVQAVDPRRAYVDGYALRIGRRATLVPSAGDRAYGVVFSLTEDEFARLYGAPGLEDYRPDEIRAQLLQGGSALTTCYNLPRAPEPGETNAEYAARLRAVLRKLEFPPEYVDPEFHKALELAQRFPGVESDTSYRTPAIRVKGKFLARLRTEAEGWLAIKCDLLDREMLLQAAPHVFHLTDHYRNYPMILVDLAEIDEDAFLDLFERAWRMAAPKKLIREYDDGKSD